MDEIDIALTDIRIQIQAIQCRIVHSELNVIHNKLSIIEAWLRDNPPDISEYQPLIESWREEKAKESKIVNHPGMKRHLVESLLDISLIRASDEWEEFKTATNRLGP